MLPSTDKIYERVSKLFSLAVQYWWVTGALLLLLYFALSNANVTKFERTIKTDAECSITPDLAASYMRRIARFDENIKDPLRSTSSSEWAFNGISKKVFCGINNCSMMENIFLAEKSEVLLYTWSSPVKFQDNYQDTFRVTCYLDGGYRFGGKWVRIHHPRLALSPFLVDYTIWEY